MVLLEVCTQILVEKRQPFFSDSGASPSFGDFHILFPLQRSQDLTHFVLAEDQIVVAPLFQQIVPAHCQTGLTALSERFQNKAEFGQPFPGQLPQAGRDCLGRGYTGLSMHLLVKARR